MICLFRHVLKLAETVPVEFFFLLVNLPFLDEHLQFLLSDLINLLVPFLYLVELIPQGLHFSPGLEKLLFNCLIVILLCHLGLLGVNGGKGLAFELAAKLLDFLLVENLLILDYFLHSLADIVDLVLEALIKLDLARNLLKRLHCKSVGNKLVLELLDGLDVQD